jgi:phospholipid transport system substrate-binding protein
MTIKGLTATFFVLCLLIGTTAAAVEPQTPMETIRERIDQVIALLNDPEGADPDLRAAQRVKLWDIASPMFDFVEISRRTVGPKWQEFSDTEKTRFTEVFTKFLSNTYIDRIQGEYQNEKIEYLQERVREPLALVRTKLIRESAEMPIDYRLRLTDGQWKIYDILVENGVSITQNYRVQFQSILQKETPEDLIQRLESRLEDQEQSRVQR